MKTDPINLPDARDLDPGTIDPKRELETCNALLDDFPALNRFYEENGYLLLRQVLDPQSIAEARDAMLAVAARLGLIEPGDQEARWTGKPFAGGMEESPEFDGIAKRLTAHPGNQGFLAKVLGDKPCMVPNVQYRTYVPNSRLAPVHQDGFYSPGIQDYRPLWITLTPCPREVGGLMIAVGQNRRGYLHNVGKTSPYPIPADAIPADSWATTDYMPGDVLIVHPYTPHVGGKNRSDRLRVSFDTRVQSASNPRSMAATVKAVTPDSITVDTDDFGERTYRVDADTFLRPVNPGVRESFDRFTEVTRPGMRLQVVVDGNRATMLRRLMVL